MKITDFKNEDAIELLADIIDPLSTILTDSKMKRLFIDAKAGKITGIKVAAKVLKAHKHEVFEIMARLDGKDPKDYTCNMITLPQQIVDITNDKELIDFFNSQVQMMESESSGLHTENIAESEN